MLVAMYGVPGLSFAEVTYLLTELGIGFAAASNRPIKIGAPDKKHVIPVVFDSAKNFLLHQEKIKFRAVAFVCDSYHRMKMEMGWPVAGVTDTPKGGHEYARFGSPELGLLIQQADRLFVPCKVNVTSIVYDPSSDIISTFGDSALAQSNTLMYKIKNRDLRSATFKFIREWFTGQTKSLERLNAQISNIHSNEKFVLALMHVMSSTEASKLRRAVIAVKESPARLDAIAKKANVPTFEIRYLLSNKAK